MNKNVQANTPWLPSGTLSTISTCMYCQLKYSECSVFMDSIHSKITRQTCQLCFLHSIDIRRRAVKLLMCYLVSFLITMKIRRYYYYYYVYCFIHYDPKYFVKLKRKNSKNTMFLVFSYLRETLTILDTGFRKGRKPKQISQ